MNKELLKSNKFKRIIEKAVKSGVYTDWGYNGEDEYPYDAFDENIAANSVIECIENYLINGDTIEEMKEEEIKEDFSWIFN
jgi:hypothetical protein